MRQHLPASVEYLKVHNPNPIFEIFVPGKWWGKSGFLSKLQEFLREFSVASVGNERAMLGRAGVSAVRDLKGQMIGALFVILTVAAVLCAVVNFQQQAKFKLPDDGVVWSERQENGSTSVDAIHVSLNGPGYKAGIRKGDKLLRIAEVQITKAIQVPQVLVAVGAWSRPDYTLRRNLVDFHA